MSDDECKYCAGDGYLPPEGDDFYESRRMCVCTAQRLYRDKLGPAVYDAGTIEKSPYAHRLKQNLFVRSYREDFLPHLRYALIYAGLDYFSRVVNDMKLLNAWFGKEKAHDPQADKEVNYESVQDLVEAPDLVVIFIGETGYKNVALPGVLLEALRSRRFVAKPTWLINPYNKPFQEGHFCHSAEVERFLTEYFDKYTLRPEGPRKRKSLADGTVSEESPNSDTDAEGGSGYFGKNFS